MAKPTALTDEHAVLAQLPPELVAQRAGVAVEIEYRRDDQQSAIQVYLGARLAACRGAGRVVITHLVAQVLLVGYPSPAELGGRVAPPPDGSRSGVVALQRPAHRQHLAPVADAGRLPNRGWLPERRLGPGR